MKAKYILLLALTAMSTITACQKEQPDIAPKIVYLDFQTQLLTTKGIPKSDFVIGDQFFVYGITTQTEDYNPEAPNANAYIFGLAPSKGVPVMNYGKNNDGVDIWKYNDPVIWSPGKSTFFGFSPVPNHAQNFGIVPPTTSFALNELPSIDFTVAGGYQPATATQADILASRTHNRKHIDLLAAYTPNQTGGKLTTLLFEHTLAQITFAVKPMQQSGFLRINSVTLHNVMTTATLNLAYAGEPTAVDFTGGWVQASLRAPKSFSINLRHDVASLIPPTPDIVYSINDSDETLMMIPQSLGSVELNINYSHSEDGVTWPEYQNGKEIKVLLSKISSHWQPSRQYRYVLAISPESGTGFEAGITEMEPETDHPTP